MQRTYIAALNFVLLIVGFLVIYSGPLSSMAIALGMLLISVSIISFAILIYFPPEPEYVRLKVVETPKTASLVASKARRKPKRTKKIKKKAKRKRI